MRGMVAEEGRVGVCKNGHENTPMVDYAGKLVGKEETATNWLPEFDEADFHGPVSSDWCMLLPKNATDLSRMPLAAVLSSARKALSDG